MAGLNPISAPAALPPSTLMAAPVAGSNTDFAAALAAARLPVADLAEPGRAFFAYQTPAGDGGIYGGYEMIEGHGLIRSILVPASLRDKGHGRAVLSALLAEVKAAGAHDVYAYSPAASAKFFIHHGFRELARYEVPPAILGARIASLTCPISTAILYRAL
ncbi:amino-acid N-acetyltransferase [Rhodobacter sp. JA431]|uniref:GNAT family N-acetyltransferase n=1 Tax=Rhodobacter sp. JA431 TaxID=570013 RepID=UPI000BCBDE87|nr:GNAT family N-acetyltransferase [Rhodobacter sp. JA431]SOC14470.1 amino-acid N-acetyltransferase [Rhodobacter sp. JA431]